MLKLFLGQNSIPIPTKLHPDLEKYDHVVFKRWSSLKYMIIDDLYIYMLPLMIQTESRSFWTEVHAIFMKLPMSNCAIDRPWDTKRELCFLLHLGCSNRVIGCVTGCCFCINNTFLVGKRGCTTLSITNVTNWSEWYDAWKKLPICDDFILSCINDKYDVHLEFCQ